VILAFIVTPTKQAKKDLEDIPVVCEYLRCLFDRLLWITTTKGSGVWD
jgi:hypothetical protein